MRYIRAAVCAGSSLAALALVGPALAQECSERLADLEARMTKLEPSSEQRRNLQELVEAARVLEWLERGQGCLTVVDEADAMLRPAEAQAERRVRRQEQAALEEQEDDLEQEPAAAAKANRGGDRQATGEAEDAITGAETSAPSEGSPRSQPEREDQPGATHPSEPDDASSREQISERLRALPANELIGREVDDREGEAVAEVDDLVRQTSDGTLFAVLSVGGFLGVGVKEVAVPLREFELGQDDRLLLPNRSADEIESLPPYNKTRYAKMSE